MYTSGDDSPVLNHANYNLFERYSVLFETPPFGVLFQIPSKKKKEAQTV